MNWLRRIAVVMGLCLLFGTPLSAAVWYVDPDVQGNGDGTMDAPWGTVAQAFQSGKLTGGDEVVLLPGSHGHIKIWNHRFETPVVLKASPLGLVRVDWIEFENSSRIVVDGLSVWPSGPTSTRPSLIWIASGASQIVLRNLEIRSREDAREYASWSVDEWIERRVIGVRINGSKTRLEDSRLLGLSFAVLTTGEDVVIRNNLIQGFSADGVQSTGNGTQVIGNFIADCVKIGGNHDDGIQAYSVSDAGVPSEGILRDVVIERNKVLETLGFIPEPMRCQLQGIGLFGGIYTNLLISNNVVSVSAWHGIAVYGAQNSAIVHNTVVHSIAPNDRAPWIGVFDASETRVSLDLEVSNNIAPLIQSSSPTAPIDPRAGNITLVRADAELLAPAVGEFALKPGSNLVDRGVVTRATPQTDLAGRPRVQGAAPDPGAYELR